MVFKTIQLIRELNCGTIPTEKLQNVIEIATRYTLNILPQILISWTCITIIF